MQQWPILMWLAMPEVAVDARRINALVDAVINEPSHRVNPNEKMSDVLPNGLHFTEFKIFETSKSTQHVRERTQCRTVQSATRSRRAAAGAQTCTT
jgi:hypothetical protein